MRAITKGTSHYRLCQRHDKYQKELQAGTASSSTNAWSNFRATADTRDTCLREQFGLCAYSEIKLDDNNLGMHLDHVEPKSLNPARTFDHQNLLLSAIDDAKKRNLAKQDVFGGHYRSNRYSKSGFLHPLRTGIRRFFYYASDGTVQPALGLSASDTRKANYTITVLNLNAPLLVNQRRHWLEELEREIDKLLNDLTALGYFAEVELCPTNNQLRPFHSAVRQRFEQLDPRLVQCVVP